MNTTSLSKLKRMFGFSTAMKPARQSESLVYVAIHLQSVDISVFSMSVRPANMQNSGINWAKGPLGSSGPSRLGSTVAGEHERDFRNMMRTKT